MVLELIVVSSIAAVGSQWVRRKKPKAQSIQQQNTDQEPVVSLERQHNDQRCLAASVALVMSSTGVLLRVPVCGVASMPLSLFAFAPIFVNALSTLRKNQKEPINDQVLVAVRASVCVVMGYYFILALDATLQSVSQRLFLRQEAKFRGNLKRAIRQHGLPLSIDRPLQPGRQQIRAEKSGERVAPWMFGLFVVTTPLMGINRSAAFLTTTFGAHLRNLGPYTAQDVIDKAMQKGIVLMQPDALERVTLVDTFVIDAQLFEGSSQAVFSHEAFEKYVVSTLFTSVSEGHAIKIYIAFDDGCTLSEVEPPSSLFSDKSVQVTAVNAKTECIEALQAAHRKVAYIYHADKGGSESVAYLNIAYCNKARVGSASAAQILFYKGDAQTLALLFELAATFVRRQRFNTIAPMGVDVVDISTTVFWDFGLVYSILFTYTGLGLGVLNNHLDKLPSHEVSAESSEADTAIRSSSWEQTTAINDS